QGGPVRCIVRCREAGGSRLCGALGIGGCWRFVFCVCVSLLEESVLLAEIFHLIQSIGFLTDFSESGLVYPVVMATHLACIAVFGGMILMTDMRLLGLALKDYTITEVVSALRPWKRVGGTIMICMGLLLGTCEADKYYPNPFFWWKMTFLAMVAIHAL